MRFGRQRLLPYRPGSTGVDKAARRLDSSEGGVIVFMQWPGTVGGGGGAIDRNGLERPDDRGKLVREVNWITHPRERGALAWQPSVHRPLAGIAVPRLADGDGRWNGQRQSRR